MANRNARRLPPFVPTETQRELVAILVAGGVTHDVIARYIENPATKKPIGVRTLEKHFREELHNGIMLANARLVEKAYHMAIGGEKTMLIFLLKTRMGYKEPAQDVLLHKTWGQLVEEAAAERPQPPALTVIEGGKAAKA